jgi:hypothetical protein
MGWKSVSAKLSTLVIESPLLTDLLGVANSQKDIPFRM